MEFDFDRDLKHAIDTVLSRFGIKNSLNKEVRELMLDYLTIREKLVQPKPRTIFIAPQLATKLPTHQKQKEIAHISDLLATGGDVNMFQNNKLFQTRFHDHLVYEWWIYHFHLSLNKDKKGFYKRTNELLFVYIEDNRAILIDTDTHREGVFAEVKWLEILNDHFPDVLEKQKDSVIQIVDPVIDSVQRQRLWDGGVTLGVTSVRNVCYWSKGIGRMTSGHSSIAVKTSHELLRWLIDTKEAFSKYGTDICAHLSIDPATTRFKMRFGKKTLEVVDDNTSYILLTYPERIQVNET